jgi:hypothetical protein
MLRAQCATIPFALFVLRQQTTNGKRQTSNGNKELRVMRNAQQWTIKPD